MVTITIMELRFLSDPFAQGIKKLQKLRAYLTQFGSRPRAGMGRRAETEL